MAVLSLGFVVLGIMLFLGMPPLCAFANNFEFGIFSTNKKKHSVEYAKSHNHR